MENSPTDLIKRYGITVHPVYVDSVDGSPRRLPDYDVYDVLLIIETGSIGYGPSCPPRTRTLLFRGYAQAPGNSILQNDGELVPPTAAEVVSSVLQDAQDAVNYSRAGEWARELSITGEPEEIVERWAGVQARYEEARKFFGDAYDDFVNAL